jgi:hypothetical protein
MRITTQLVGRETNSCRREPAFVSAQATVDRTGRKINRPVVFEHFRTRISIRLSIAGMNGSVQPSRHNGGIAQFSGTSVAS